MDCPDCKGASIWKVRSTVHTHRQLGEALRPCTHTYTHSHVKHHCADALPLQAHTYTARRGVAHQRPSVRSDVAWWWKRIGSQAPRQHAACLTGLNLSGIHLVCCLMGPNLSGIHLVKPPKPRNKRPEWNDNWISPAEPPAPREVTMFVPYIPRFVH
eukprot:1148103-Pelagomonas_calceolata.AAC.8